MTTETTVNGAEKSGKTAAAGKDAVVGREGQDGFQLFGNGAKTHDELTANIANWLKTGSNGSPAKGEARNGKHLEHTIEEEPDRDESKEPPHPDPLPQGGEGEDEEIAAEVENPQHDAESEEAEEEHEPSAADKDSSPEGPQGKDKDEADAAEKGWPKSAVAKVAEMRQERRTLKETLETQKSRLNEALERLESEELKRPVQVPGDPLGFAQTPEALEKWAAVAEGNLDLIEGFLDESLTRQEQRRLQIFAQENGAWNEADETVDKDALKQLRKGVREALAKHVPQKRDYFAKAKQYEAAVEKDPVLGAVWKDKTGEAYKDAMGVLETIPEIRRLPHYKQAAAIFALGLAEYRRQQKSAGDGKSAAGAAGGGEANPTKESGTRGARPSGEKKAKSPVPTVKGPGRTTVLPRNPSAAEAEEQVLVGRVRKPNATNEDYVDYARRALTGKIGR